MKCFFIITILFILFQRNVNAFNNKNDSTIVTLKCDTIPFTDDQQNTHEYLYNYIKVESSNNTISNKLNYFFFHLDPYEYNDISKLQKKLNYSQFTYEQLYTTSIDSIKNLCKKIEKSGEVAQLLDHSYVILFNSYNLLCVWRNWSYYSFAPTYNEYYTIDTETGESLILDSVIRSDKQTIIFKEIKSKVELTIKEELEFNKDYPEFKEMLDENKHEYKIDLMHNFNIKNKNEIEGIEFRFSYGYPWGFKGYEPSFELFFSFEELKPYLTEGFRQRIFDDK